MRDACARCRTWHADAERPKLIILGVVFHAGSFSSGCLMWEKTKWGEFLTTKVGLDISQTNAGADSQWNTRHFIQFVVATKQFYIYIYVYIYIYLYTYNYIYIHIFIYKYIYIYKYPYIYIYMYIYIYTCTFIYVYVYMYMYIFFLKFKSVY